MKYFHKLFYSVELVIPLWIWISTNLENYLIPKTCDELVNNNNVSTWCSYYDPPTSLKSMKNIFDSIVTVPIEFWFGGIEIILFVCTRLFNFVTFIEIYWNISNHTVINSILVFKLLFGSIIWCFFSFSFVMEKLIWEQSTSRYIIINWLSINEWSLLWFDKYN